MTTILEQGFLATDMTEYTKEILDKRSAVFSLAADLNVFAQKLFVNCSDRARSDNHLVIILYFVRILEHFQAIYLLEERNMFNASGALVRVMCEAMMCLCACAQNQDFYLKIVEWDALTVKRIGAKIQQLPESVAGLTKEERQIIQDKTEQARKEVKRLQERNKEAGTGEENELKMDFVAKQAGLEDFYNTIYALHCMSVHTAVRDLDKHVEFHADGNREINWGPELENNMDCLASAIAILLTAVNGFLIALPEPKAEAEMRSFALRLENIERAIITRIETVLAE